MTNQTRTYDALAALLAYPDGSTSEYLDVCRTALGAHVPAALEQLEPFTQFVEHESLEELQELYTRTFDLNPVCSLEVGWQLFGENYSRGEFLVDMRHTLRRLDVPETTELPDHLTHVLRAFGRMRASEADRFASRFLLPALGKMSQGLAGSECPYAAVLEAIQTLVLSPYGAVVEVAS